jgi:hypothetical protein
MKEPVYELLIMHICFCCRTIIVGSHSARRYSTLDMVHEISGSHSDECEDGCLLGCCAL